MQPSKKTLLVMCQVYAPDPAAVGQQVTSAAEEMARRGWRVVVYTAARGYEDPSQRYTWRETRNGVDVRRLPLSSFGKNSIARRLLAQSLFMAQAVLRGLCTRNLRLVLVSTSPPFAGYGGAVVSWLRRKPLVWWVMDLNPDQMVAAGKLAQRSLAVRIFEWLNRATLARAKAVVTLDRFMMQRLAAKMPGARAMSIVPPWPHDDHGQRRPLHPNAFRATHGLADAFVVMYSGNHAIQHPLDTLLEAARAFEHDPRIVFAFVGGGAGKAEVDRRIAAGAANLRSFSFQPLSRIADSLSAADLHVVSMGNDVVGIVHPCKIYGAMAVGRPILFFGPPQSHAGEILAAHHCGRVVAHGDVAAAVAAIRKFVATPPEERERLGHVAAAAVASQYAQHLLRGRFCDILEQAAGSQHAS
jgi:colanic acid biosynthesis glycosyl transferase WcaI